jgi:hypothetical protein
MDLQQRSRIYALVQESEFGFQEGVIRITNISKDLEDITPFPFQFSPLGCFLNAEVAKLSGGNRQALQYPLKSYVANL